MKKANGLLVGALFIIVGLLYACSALDLFDFTIFFRGWWTLFIIIPCGIGLFTEREKIGNIIGILIGVLLLLCCQEILSFSVLWKLLLPALIVIIGLKMVLSGLFGNKANEIIKKLKQDGKTPKTGFAAFSGNDIVYDGEVFESAELTAVFGGIKLDLRNAIIMNDCAVTVTSIFGGIDILVPEGINVKVNSNNIFGGVSNKTTANRDAHTIYVSGTCLFGGVDIK